MIEYWINHPGSKMALASVEDQLQSMNCSRSGQGLLMVSARLGELIAAMCMYLPSAWRPLVLLSLAISSLPMQFNQY